MFAQNLIAWLHVGILGSAQGQVELLYDGVGVAAKSDPDSLEGTRTSTARKLTMAGGLIAGIGAAGAVGSGIAIKTPAECETQMDAATAASLRHRLIH